MLKAKTGSISFQNISTNGHICHVQG